VSSAADIVELHPGWPAKRPFSVEAGRALHRRSTIVAALGHLASLPEVAVETSVKVFSKPRRVEACDSFKAGGLVLFPETTAVKSHKAAEIVEESPLQEVTFVPADEGFRHFLQPAVSAEAVAPYWLVGHTESPAQANMELQHVVVQGLLAHDYFPQGCVQVTRQPTSIAASSAAPEAEGEKKKRRLTGKTQDEKLDGDEGCASDTPSTWRAKLPILVNCKALRAGDTLLLYRKATKKEKAPQPIAVTALTKKATAK